VSEQKDPPRLAESEPSSKLGRVFSEAARDLPSDSELAKLAERLGPVLGAPAPVAGASLSAKLGVLAGVAAIIAGGAVVVRQRTPPSGIPSVSPVTSAIHAPSAVATDSAQASAPSIASATEPLASATAPSISIPSSASTTPAARPSPPSEATLLERARRALTSDPAGALALTNQDAALHPHGVLTQEREVIAIEALRRLNRGAEADRRAAAFGRAYPGSAHQRTVEDAGTK